MAELVGGAHDTTDILGGGRPQLRSPNLVILPSVSPLKCMSSSGKTPGGQTDELFGDRVGQGPEESPVLRQRGGDRFLRASEVMWSWGPT